VEKMHKDDFGSMYLPFDSILAVKSSSSILFFKKSLDDGKWFMYKEMKNMNGNIFYIKGNVRIQVVTELKIYFILLEGKEPYLPSIENVMYNFMRCNNLMFGKMVKNGIAFTINKPGFTLFRKKF
jgi:hypothetical protein